MGAYQQLTTPTVVINNEVWEIIPNSFMYTEGFGEQNIKTLSGGGGTVSVVYVDDVTTHFSDVKFEVLATDQSIPDKLRVLKANSNQNTISATTGSFSRVFQNAILTSNYEVNLGADKTIAIEFKSSPAK